MKIDDIQRLLQKRQEGTIDPEELAELNRLTHKTEVLSSAFHKADRIIYRRRLRNISLALCGAVVLGIGIWAIVPSQKTLEPMVAHVQDEPAATDALPPAPTTAPSVVEAAPATEEPLLVASANPVEQVEPVPQPDATVKTPPTPASRQQTVVVCNVQCETDSVISNIWKFLSA